VKIYSFIKKKRMIIFRHIQLNWYAMAEKTDI